MAAPTKRPAGSRLQFFVETTGVALGEDANMANGITYYAEFVSINDAYVATHLIWDAAVVATVTWESSNDPTAETYDLASGGKWVDEADIADVAINLAAGADMMQHASWCAARGRVKVAVTTGGRCYGYRHSKV